MTEITSIKARQIFDSRGIPTIECELTTYDGTVVAGVPSGTSMGRREALELRDGGKAFDGKGVSLAVLNINNTIAKKLVGMDPTDQRFIDSLMIDMDGTDNKSKLGANAILAVSTAVCKAGALAMHKDLYEYLADLAKSHMKLPTLPYVLMIEGGQHAGGALSIQEFFVIAEGQTFKEKFYNSVEIYQALKKMIASRYGASGINVGYEGAFAPSLNATTDAIELMLKAAEEVGVKTKLAVDAAASSFFDNGIYNLDGRKLSPESMVDFYTDLVSTYPVIVSIEDPLAESDWEAWTQLTDRIGEQVRVVGDDLLVTNPKIIEQAFSARACNALLLKVNQIGSVTEAIDAWKRATYHRWPTIVSHRSGETNDSFIADLAVALGADIKTGAPCRGERLAKYNRLLKIEELMRE